MNSIRSVLLHLDATPSSAARLEFARRFALRHEATLSAMFVAWRPQRPVQPAFTESPAALPHRLLAQPAATRCTHCQAEAERRSTLRG